MYLTSYPWDLARWAQEEGIYTCGPNTCEAFLPAEVLLKLDIGSFCFATDLLTFLKKQLPEKATLSLEVIFRCVSPCNPVESILPAIYCLHVDQNKLKSKCDNHANSAWRRNNRRGTNTNAGPAPQVWGTPIVA